MNVLKMKAVEGALLALLLAGSAQAQTVLGPLEGPEFVPTIPTVVAPGMPGTVVPGMIPGTVPGMLPVTTVPSYFPAIAADLLAWCSQVHPILAQAEFEAGYQVRLGNNVQALAILRDGMQAAVNYEASVGRAQTMTGRTLQRGIELIGSLVNDFSPLDPILTQALTGFAFAWNRMIIQSVIRLDREWYIPYTTYYDSCGGGCVGGFDFMAFQRQYLQVVQAQLRLVTTALANGYQPLSSARFFLRAAQRLARKIGREDLVQSPNAYNYACFIFDLERLVSFIQRNLNTPAMHRQTVMITVDTINHIAAYTGVNACSAMPVVTPGAPYYGVNPGPVYY